jgi:septal ring-binding cell division protein DamX
VRRFFYIGLVALAGCGMFAAEPELAGPPVDTATSAESEHWRCARNEQGRWICRDRSAATGDAPRVGTLSQPVGPREASAAPSTTAAAPPPAPDVPASSGATAVSPQFASADYVLQVSAYRSESGAREALAARPDDGLRLQRTRDEGGYWYVLVAGAWPTLAEAVAAEAAYLARHPDGSTWIRRGSDFTEAP